MFCFFTSSQVYYYFLNVKYIKNHPTDHTVMALEASTCSRIKKCESELAPLYFYYKLSLLNLYFFVAFDKVKY